MRSLLQALKAFFGRQIDEAIEPSGVCSSSPAEQPLAVVMDIRPFMAGIESLEEIAKRSPEIVDRLLCFLDSGPELGRFDVVRRPSRWTNELRIVLQPADAFVEFVRAAGATAGDLDDM